MKTLKKYLNIYSRLFAFSLKSKMAYRWNFFVELFYGPAYVFMLYVLVKTAFSRVTILGGFTIDQGILLFCVAHLMYILSNLFFIMGLRHLLWDGVRLGQMDSVLTKPINPQFLVSFQRPEFQQIPLLVGLLFLFIRQLHIVSTVTFGNFLIFCLLFVFGVCIVYFSISTYTTAAFYITKAMQVLEIFDKVSDNAQYPTVIYPQSFQLLSVTFIPIAFFGYIPTLFLLGKGSLQLFLLPIIFLIIIIPVNQLAWKIGLRHYSSASS